MRNLSLVTALGVALLCVAAPCLAAPPKAPAPKRPEVSKPAPAKLPAPGWIRWSAEPRPQPRWRIPLPNPLDSTNDDPEVCPVPLERGHCPIG